MNIALLVALLMYKENGMRWKPNKIVRGNASRKVKQGERPQSPRLDDVMRRNGDDCIMNHAECNVLSHFKMSATVSLAHVYISRVVKEPVRSLSPAKAEETGYESSKIEGLMGVMSPAYPARRSFTTWFSTAFLTKRFIHRHCGPCRLLPPSR